jgi:hypothetical protein
MGVWLVDARLAEETASATSARNVTNQRTELAGSLTAVAPIIAPILTPIPTPTYAARRDHGGTSHRGGAHHRSTSNHAWSSDSTSTQHLRLLP